MRSSRPRTPLLVVLAILAGLAAVALADAARASPGELASAPATGSGVAALARRLLHARDGDNGGHDNDDNDGHDDGPSSGGSSGSGSSDNDDDHGPGHNDDSDDDNDGLHDNEDDDAYDHDPTLGVAGIQDCKAALTALSLPYAGSTVFCPRASGMLWLAKYFGFASTAELLADIGPSGAGASRAAATAYFKLLVSPGRVLTQPLIPVGVTTLPTLLGSTPGGQAAVRKEVRTEDGRTRYKVDFVYPGGDTDVQAFDLTFDGVVASNSTPSYVVHALEHPVAPQGAYRASDDMFRRQRTALSSSAKLFKALLREKKRGSGSGVSRTGTMTLLLPTNAAWQSAGVDVKSIQRDKARKAELLAYLTLPGDVRPGGAGTPFAAAGHPSVAADGTVTGGSGTAKIVATYVAGRYVVHTIDGVVVPAGF